MLTLKPGIQRMIQNAMPTFPYKADLPHGRYYRKLAVKLRDLMLTDVAKALAMKLPKTSSGKLLEAYRRACFAALLP